MKRHFKLLIIGLSLVGVTFSPARVFAADLTATTIEAKKKPFQMSQLGDVDLSCGQLSREALRMRDIIQRKQDIKDDSEIKDRGISAAGAVGSLLLGSVTGGVGLAAAGFLASQAVEKEADKADSIQNIADRRRGFMIGIYKAKGCFGPTEHVMLAPVENDLASRLASTEPAAGADEHRYND